MCSSGQVCKVPIGLLSQDELQLIHEKSLEILWKTGVKFHWKPALLALKKAGCAVDFESECVRIPRDVVEEALRTCARTFRFKARDPRYDLEFAPGRVHFTIQHAAKMYDLETGKRRGATIKDLEQIVTIEDALDNIHSVNAPIQVIEDRPPHVYNEWTLATALRKSIKLPVGSGFNFGARWHIDIARVAGVELPGEFTSASPLSYVADQCDGIMRFAEAGWGSMIMGGVLGGASGPATIAGILLLQNAEILAGLTLCQAVHPGSGCNYGIQSRLIDMRYGCLAYGIEMYMIVCAGAQMGRYYGLTTSSYNSFSGGKYPMDQQVGYEKAMAALIAGQSGVTFNFAAGGIDDETCFSIEQLIIDDEMYSMVGRFLKGIAVDVNTLAAELIKEVGPSPGNFLGRRHTRDSWKGEQFLPAISYRRTLEEWVKEGCRDTVTRARDRAREIIRTHEVPPLPDAVDREIAKLLSAAEKEKQGK